MIPKNISVVVPSHNREKSLKFLLKSFDNLKLPPKEVIIINDGSKDNTKKVLKEWQEKNHMFIPIVFNNPISRGPAYARNIGIKLASGEAIAFTDDDCVVHHFWIKSIKESNIWNSSRRIVGIGGKVLHYRDSIISRYYTFHRILEPPRYNQYLVTANACYLKDHLVEVNGFDVSHKYPGGEDNGLSFKLAKKGFTFGYEKNMIIWHDYRTSIISFFKTFYQYGKGCAEVSQKYLTKISKHEKEVIT